MNVDIEAIKRKLLVKYPPFGGVVANSNFIADETIQTACTDGKDIFYNPLFVSQLSEMEQVFVLAHEVGHIAFNHINRCEGKDARTWNIAADAVLNALFKKDGLPIINGAVDMAEAVNYDVEQMYEKILEQKKNEELQKGKQDNKEKTTGSASNANNSDTENQDVGHDTHSMWSKAVEKRKEQEQASQKQQSEADKKADNVDKKKESIFDKLFNRNKEKKQVEESINQEDTKEKQEDKEEKERNKKRNEAVKDITNMGEKKFFKQNKIDREKRLKELRDELINQTFAGKGSNGDVRKVNDIGVATPLVDWRRLLREAVSYEVDWSYRNASIEDGVVVPYLEDIPTPETEILLDTSGSISKVLLKNFLRECKNILQSSKVKVGCFDDEFYGFTEIRDENDIDNMQFDGGGGTDFNVAVNAFTRRVENKIIFTDGCAPMPNKAIDAIWIVFGGREIAPKGGRVINITGEQFDRLMSNNLLNDSGSKRRR